MGTELMGSDARYHPDYEGIADLADSGVSVDWTDFRALVEFLCREHRTSRSRWAAVVGTLLATACVLLYKQDSASRHTLDLGCGAQFLQDRPRVGPSVAVLPGLTTGRRAAANWLASRT